MKDFFENDFIIKQPIFEKFNNGFLFNFKFFHWVRCMLGQVHDLAFVFLNLTKKKVERLKCYNCSYRWRQCAISKYFGVYRGQFIDYICIALHA